MKIQVFVLLFLSLTTCCFTQFNFFPRKIFSNPTTQGPYISSSCSSDGIVLVTNETVHADQQQYELYLLSCLAAAAADNDTSIKCQASSNSSAYKTDCQNNNATLCSVTLSNSNSTGGDFDFVYYYCIPKSCNSTDLNILTQRLSAANNQSSFQYQSDVVILKASIKCGGLSAWVVVLIVVVIAVAILLAIVIVVVVLRRRRDEYYTPISSGGQDYGSGGYQPQQGY
jgi:subtilase family serine protease